MLWGDLSRSKSCWNNWHIHICKISQSLTTWLCGFKWTGLLYFLYETGGFWEVYFIIKWPNNRWARNNEVWYKLFHTSFNSLHKKSQKNNAKRRLDWSSSKKQPHNLDYLKSNENIKAVPEFKPEWFGWHSFYYVVGLQFICAVEAEGGEDDAEDVLENRGADNV